MSVCFWLIAIVWIWCILVIWYISTTYLLNIAWRMIIIYSLNEIARLDVMCNVIFEREKWYRKNPYIIGRKLGCGSDFWISVWSIFEVWDVIFGLKWEFLRYGVLKTRTGVRSLPGLTSWSIYTPTQKFHIQNSSPLISTSLQNTKNHHSILILKISPF